MPDDVRPGFTHNIRLGTEIFLNQRIHISAKTSYGSIDHGLYAQIDSDKLLPRTDVVHRADHIIKSGRRIVRIVVLFNAAQHTDPAAIAFL